MTQLFSEAVSPRGDRWSVIDLEGKLCDIQSPRSGSESNALIFLHDFDPASSPAESALQQSLEQSGFAIIAPRAHRSWWLDSPIPSFDTRFTPERFVIDHVIAEIGRRWNISPPGIAIVGAGMGGQGALRLSYRYPARLPIAAAVCPSIDFHLAMRDDAETFAALWNVYTDVEQARQDTAILHIHPLNWPRHQFFAAVDTDQLWFDGAVRLRMKLSALGIPCTTILENSLGDSSYTFHHRAAEHVVAFVRERFGAESRRIP